MTGGDLNKIYENELKKNRKSSYAEYLIKNGEQSDEIYHDERIKATNSLLAKDTDYGVRNGALTPPILKALQATKSNTFTEMQKSS